MSVETEDEKPKARRVVRKAAITKKKASPKKGTPKKKAAPVVKSQRETPKSGGNRKRKVDSESEDEDEGEDMGSQNEVKVLKQVQNRSPKEQLVADILCRWWYVMPDWPPVEFDFASALQQAGLRLVTLDRWEDEPDQDEQGLVKCYALTQFKGVYRDAKGMLRDLRPHEGKPCFSNLISKNEKELQSMLSAALGRQIEILSRKPTEESLMADLREKLKTVGKKK